MKLFVICEDSKHPAFINFETSLQNQCTIYHIDETDFTTDILSKKVETKVQNDDELLLLCFGNEVLCVRKDINTALESTFVLANKPVVGAFTQNKNALFIAGRKKFLLDMLSKEFYTCQTPLEFVETACNYFPDSQNSLFYPEPRVDEKMNIEPDFGIRLANDTIIHPFFVLYNSLNYRSSIPIMTCLQPDRLFSTSKNYTDMGKMVNGHYHIAQMPVNMKGFVAGLWVERSISALLLLFLFIVAVVCIARLCG